jgi:hypothetical protein
VCLCVRVCVCVPDYLALAAACITANARAVKSVEELGDEKREREKEREREKRERDVLESEYLVKRRSSFPDPI